MTPEKRPVEINISGIPVAGVGGLGLVAMAVLVSVVRPEIGWMMVPALCGGVVTGVALVLARRVWKGSGPSGDDPKILFRDLPADSGRHAEVNRERHAPDGELLIANL